MLLTGGPIVTDAAIIVLSGAGSDIEAGTGTGVTPYQSVEQTLTTIAAGGQLQVLANRAYSSVMNLTDSGIVQLGGGTFQTASLGVTSGGKILGFGTVQDSVSNTGTIEAMGGTLTVTGQVTGVGIVRADAVSTLSLTGVNNQAGTAITNGTVSLGAGDHLTRRDGRSNQCRRLRAQQFVRAGCWGR